MRKPEFSVNNPVNEMFVQYLKLYPAFLFEVLFFAPTFVPIADFLAGNSWLFNVNFKHA